MASHPDPERFSPRLLARVVGILGLVGILTGAFDIGYVHNSLMVADDASATLRSTQVQQAGLLLSWVFYGIDELATGFLFFRSAFFPRILAALLGLSGLCYFTHGFLSFLAPSVDAWLYPYIIFPCLPGEGLSSLWLATMGVNVEKWRAWTAEPRGEEALA